MATTAAAIKVIALLLLLLANHKRAATNVVSRYERKRRATESQIRVVHSFAIKAWVRSAAEDCGQLLTLIIVVS
jgi:hypothetical protein